MGCPHCYAPQGYAQQWGRAGYGVRCRSRASLRYAPLPLVAPSASLTRVKGDGLTFSSDPTDITHGCLCYLRASAKSAGAETSHT
ncbi:MAG: hypothetical protein RML37_09110, partial [Chitinophagales bacterium]|nr:hypothetical protein [Chitinophagales bacterium]